MPQFMGHEVWLTVGDKALEEYKCTNAPTKRNGADFVTCYVASEANQQFKVNLKIPKDGWGKTSYKLGLYLDGRRVDTEYEFLDSHAKAHRDWVDAFDKDEVEGHFQFSNVQYSDNEHLRGTGNPALGRIEFILETYDGSELKPTGPTPFLGSTSGRLHEEKRNAHLVPTHWVSYRPFEEKMSASCPGTPTKTAKKDAGEPSKSAGGVKSFCVFEIVYRSLGLLVAENIAPRSALGQSDSENGNNADEEALSTSAIQDWIRDLDGEIREEDDVLKGRNAERDQLLLRKNALGGNTTLFPDLAQKIKNADFWIDAAKGRRERVVTERAHLLTLLDARKTHAGSGAGPSMAKQVDPPASAVARASGSSKKRAKVKIEEEDDEVKAIQIEIRKAKDEIKKAEAQKKVSKKRLAELEEKREAKRIKLTQ